jgi:hypothetical protein
MLHVRTPTYIASLLFLVPSAIVTLRILEVRRKEEIEKKCRTQESIDLGAIPNMSILAGT